MTKIALTEPTAPALDRRTFLGGAVLTMGAVLLPGFPRALRAESLQGSGHVDDACGHWPPYSHAIPYGHVAPAASVWDAVDPVDRLFLT